MIYLHNQTDIFNKSIFQAWKKSGILPIALEKDYYVTLILLLLTERFSFVVFKGGTSLSKCYEVINRFSEDIDITTNRPLSQGEKKKLKYGIVDICNELGLHITNIDKIRSRRDYNKYIISYHSFYQSDVSAIKSQIIIETFYSTYSFPTKLLPINSYIAQNSDSESAQQLLQYNLHPFTMNVQSLERTFIDKIFALCDYYLQGRIRKHSRHIYDIYKLYPLMEFNSDFIALFYKIKDDRSKLDICPSAKPDVDLKAILYELINSNIYKEDYENITQPLLTENVNYNTAISALGNFATTLTNFQ